MAENGNFQKVLMVLTVTKQISYLSKPWGRYFQNLCVSQKVRTLLYLLSFYMFTQFSIDIKVSQIQLVQLLNSKKFLVDWELLKTIEKTKYSDEYLTETYLLLMVEYTPFRFRRQN